MDSANDLAVSNSKLAIQVADKFKWEQRGWVIIGHDYSGASMCVGGLLLKWSLAVI